VGETADERGNDGRIQFVVLGGLDQVAIQVAICIWLDSR
jgi:hypothetical protein